MGIQLSDGVVLGVEADVPFSKYLNVLRAPPRSHLPQSVWAVAPRSWIFPRGPWPLSLRVRRLVGLWHRGVRFDLRLVDANPADRHAGRRSGALAAMA
jgi:hypothetical protein